jgi:peptidoglycan hydrolase-like protein with peptidoglycan-binding domain
VKQSGVKSPKSGSKSKKVASRTKKRRKPVRGQRTIESARVLEIQNALAAAGYYKTQPNGEWDDSTSKAMSAYQQDNGFRTTGKPDALSLKKLGL